MLDDSLKRCYALANELAEQYALYARTDHDKKSMDDLIHVFKDYMNNGATIVLKDLDIAAKPDSVVRGAMLRRGNIYEIYVIEGDVEENRRFVTCKELFQTLLDDEDMWNMNLNAHVQELGAADFIVNAASAAVESEKLAEIAAMQFLYPYQERVADIARIRSGECTYQKISDHYGLPQIYVEIYLNEIVMDKLRPSHGLSVVQSASGAV